MVTTKTYFCVALYVYILLNFCNLFIILVICGGFEWRSWGYICIIYGSKKNLSVCERRIGHFRCCLMNVKKSPK